MTPDKWTRGQRLHVIGSVGWLVGLIVAFQERLGALWMHAYHSDLHSHIVLVPLISAYLLWNQRGQLPGDFAFSPRWAVFPLVVGLLLGFGGIGGSLALNDLLALRALAFVLLLVAGGFLFLGRKWMSAAAFPLAFLIFMVPLPDGAVDWLETGSKLASAEAAAIFFKLSGTPVLRDGVIFQLPGIVIEVAQECSGIRSSWVLFLTGLLATHLFLESSWRKVVLVAFVIPLGIVRNGFRIMVIGLLCVNVGPHMIHSPIHRRGGPLFFVLSLVPLALLLWWLRRSEMRARE